MNKIKLIIFLNLLFSIEVSGQSAIEIAKIGIQSTVSIVALDNISQPLGYGSGFIIADELIVTNVHVVEGAGSAYVLLNGQEKKYTVSGYVAIDRTNDLIILKVPGLAGSKLNLGSEIFPEIGEKIYAVGNPKGLNGTFSEGIISGIRELVTNQVLQITAPISPGSSGGPVLNSAGQVVGIAFASYSEGQNLNFAIPVKYLITLNSKIGTVIPISTIKAKPKTAKVETVNPNIKEGVSVRNLVIDYNWSPTHISFSIKNNLSYTVSDIKILFLIYDATGIVVDYLEDTYAEGKGYYGDVGEIKPFLARSIEFNVGYPPKLILKSGYKIKARILDFKIIEE